MASPLKSSIVVRTLARDLGIVHPTDPVSQIVTYCEERVRKFLREFPDSEGLSGLLELVTAKVQTCFRIVNNDHELISLRDEYLRRGEAAFANLPQELGPDVFGITLSLQERQAWELPFVSIIDCRGEKIWRGYFTKWHELAHLLTLTSQTRLAFKRTHCAEIISPEESLMDIIAGRFAFYAPVIRKYAKGVISFEAIENLRQQLCPEASKQSSVIGITEAWPSPCLLVTAEMALKKGEQTGLNQGRFGFSKGPESKLRATRVKANDEARGVGFRIFENMRVPEQSVIFRVHENDLSYGDQSEDLSWWVSSDGTALGVYPVRVEARRSAGDFIEALISPLDGCPLN
jgi:hypothetical protein